MELSRATRFSFTFFPATVRRGFSDRSPSSTAYSSAVLTSRRRPFAVSGAARPPSSLRPSSLRSRSDTSGVASSAIGRVCSAKTAMTSACSFGRFSRPPGTSAQRMAARTSLGPYFSASPDNSARVAVAKASQIPSLVLAASSSHRSATYLRANSNHFVPGGGAAPFCNLPH